VARLMEEDDILAEKTAEHICWLTDANKLYDNALGLYNLELALLIAQQSQKDPREYLPFTQNLQQLSDLHRRFRIDDYLGRHAKALGHLRALNLFDEVQVYTRKHSLYQTAMGLYRYDPAELAVITGLYAQYLEAKSSFKEAALAYESLRNYPRATSCYLSTGPSMWREALFCALSQSPPLPSASLCNLVTSLSDALIESKDYFAAATIQVEHLSSVENATRTLCKGYYFADALHLVALKGRHELLESVIDIGLAEALATSTELLAECKAQLLAQVPRIRELRARAMTDPLVFYEGERDVDGEMPDDVSVAASSRLSTNRSLFTRYTGKGTQAQTLGTAATGVSRTSSKIRRREERKRARGKKGSVYEEEYLVNSVGRLIQKVESIRDEVVRLTVGLVRRNMWEQAKAVEENLAEVIEGCRASIPEVYGVLERSIPAKASREEGYGVTGADAVLREGIETIGQRKEPPYMAVFEKLPILTRPSLAPS